MDPRSTFESRRAELGGLRADVFRNLPSHVLIVLVRLYQCTLSPFLGGQCRFEPSCSHYFIAAVQKYGAWRGALKGLARILRCHPFHPGGYDPP